MIECGIAVFGAEDRLGCRQHLERGLLPLRRRGGVLLPGGHRLLPEPVLCGDDPARLGALAAHFGGLRWSTDRDAVLSDPAVHVCFTAEMESEPSARPGVRELSAGAPDEVYHGVLADGPATDRRPVVLRAAAQAGKHIYSETPAAPEPSAALELAELAASNGVVAEKLYMPGIAILKRLLESGSLGTLLAVRSEFGFWVDPGPGARTPWPDWKFRAEDGGGIVAGAVIHWQYLIESLFGRIDAVTCRTATHIPQRMDRLARPRTVTAEDAAYVLFELESGVIVSANFSWRSRPYRGELARIQVDGTRGSAVAALRHCRVLPAELTVPTVWNPDRPDPCTPFDPWREADVQPAVFDEANIGAYQHLWADYLRCAATGRAYPHGLVTAARGLQIVDAALLAAREGRTVPVPPLTTERHG
jgi:predicted dehydrogenase